MDEDIIWLGIKQRMMCCAVCFCGSDAEVIRKLTGEILAIRNLGECDWIVETHKGIRDVLEEGVNI